jgi:ArsR family transcriptional regulator
MPTKTVDPDLSLLARRLKAVSDPERLRILSLLPATPKCEAVYNVSELSAELGLAQPTVSHHLAILHQASLVRREKMCRDVYYWVDAPALAVLQAELGGLVQR